MLDRSRPIVAVSLSACAALGCADTPPNAWYLPTFGSYTDAAVEKRDIPPSIAPSIAGRWGLLQTDTESAAVNLSQQGDILTGLGCGAGLPDMGDVWDRFLASECGPIMNGRIDGRRVTFEFYFAFSGGWSYATDAWVSQDGTRMAGRLSTTPSFDGGAAYDWQTFPTAWGRIGPQDAWFERRAWPTDTDVEWHGAPGYDLTLRERADAGEFTSNHVYRVWRVGDGLVGDLGSFMRNEIKFLSGPGGETNQIVAGPVPETAPNLPVRLELTLENGALATLQAETPSGATYSFAATKHFDP